MRKALLYTLMTTFTFLSLLSCGTVTEDLGATPYYGPSDVYSLAVGWWGLRAFGQAQVGTKIAHVHCVNATTEMDISSTPLGDFDVKTLQAACPSDTYLVSTLYDQSGNSVNLTQADPTHQPALNLNCIGTLPCLVFSGAQFLSGNIPAVVQPLSLTAMAMTSNTSDSTIIGNNPTAQATLGYTSSSSNSVVVMSSGTHLDSASIAGSSYHSIGAVFSSTVSTLTLDGSTTVTGDANTNGLSGTLYVGSTPSGGYLTGQIIEVGVWSIPFNPLQLQILSTSDHSYWGF